MVLDFRITLFYKLSKRIRKCNYEVFIKMSAATLLSKGRLTSDDHAISVYILMAYEVDKGTAKNNN
jgi:hypothetical protein